MLLVGGGGSSPVEQVIQGARQAAAHDLLETLAEAGVVERAIIATDDGEWARSLESVPLDLEVDLDPPDRPFHFGQRLADLIEQRGLERVLYAGGGSAPLMEPGEWRQALEGFGKETLIAVTNNLHSSDWVAFYPAADLAPLVAEQERDNALGWVLAHTAGVPTVALPPSAASRFDLDTPADLLIARAHPGVASHLRAMLDSVPWPADPIDGVLEVMAREGGHLTIIGRSAAAAWSALGQATRCWVRMFVEERGMIASGRAARGEVQSLLADFVNHAGIEGFFAELEALSEAVLMDSRVILAARELWPPAADRFNADLFRWQNVQEPFLRRFSQAAAGTAIPILMGGQSVVNGGLLALVDVLATTRRHG